MDPVTPRKGNMAFNTPMRSVHASALAPSPFLAASPRLDHPSSPLAQSRGSPTLNSSPRAEFSPARSPQFGDIEGSPLRSPGTLDRSPRAPAPVPRLVIHKLVLINFKSYAGRQEIGPFNTSFSAVVGPNGSGKSNVIDSLLFVFGFRATKMRQAKLTALIHKSEAFPNLDSARVEVHFEEVIDTPLGSEKIEGSELVVSREVSHSSGSSYYINNRGSTYTEVTTLLKGRGIDLDHKRFLILQGEVESIALMKPKADGDGDDGLLEYLEDIIGTSHYKEQIKQAETEIETLKVEVEEKRGRMDLAARDLDQLDNRRKDIAYYIQHHNAGTIARSKLLQKQIFSAIATEAAAQQALDAAEAEQEQYQERNADFIAELDRNKAHQAELAANLKAAQEAVRAHEKARQKANLANVKLKTQHQQLEAQLKKAEKSFQAANSERALAENWLANFATDRAHQTSQQAELELTLVNEETALEAIQAKLQSKTKGISDEMEVLQQQVEPWRVQIQNKETEMAKLRSNTEFMVARLEEDHAKWQEATAVAQKIADDGLEKSGELKRAQQAHKSAQATLDAVETELGAAVQAVSAAQAKVGSQRAAVAAARDSRNSQQTNNRMLSALLQLRDKGQLRGFYGRLGALGTIDKQFDIAVSTACPRLDDFVVDTVETGQKCIQFLRQNRLGSARFILLDQMPKPRQDFTPPPGVRRLYDLISVENAHFLPAFYSVLRDTLVARTPEEARRIALGGRQRYRVVSLQGVLVEPQGTMSGGGEPSRGRMTIKGSAAASAQAISADAMAELEQGLARTEMELVEARSTQQELQNQKSELEADLPRLDLECKKLKMAIEQLTEQMNDAKNRRRELKALYEQRSAADAPARAAAQQEMGKLESDKRKLETESQALEVQIAELQERILQAGGLELRMQSSRVSDLRGQISAISDRISQLDEERGRQDAQIKRHTAAAESAAAEQATLEQEVAKVAAQRVDLDAQEKQLDNETQSLLKSAAEATDALQAAKDAAAAAQESLDEVKSVLIEIHNRLTEAKKTLSGARAAVRDMRQKLGKLHVYDPQQAADLRYASDAEPKPELCEYDENQLTGFDTEELEKIVKVSDKNLETKKLDLSVLDDYRSRFAEYVTRRDAVNEVVERHDGLKAEWNNLKQRRFDEFMEGFQQISDKLKEMYQMITMGGNAELELVDHLDPFAEGILFSVMPPKKSWRNIANLSGGEKTLSSLALVFALHHYKPTPLYVMDEIDAALDFRNVSIVANYIKERTTNGQFIVISLRNNMFELASRLVGIYKVNNMTRSVTIVNTPRASN